MCLSIFKIKTFVTTTPFPREDAAGLRVRPTPRSGRSGECTTSVSHIKAQGAPRPASRAGRHSTV
ncbi:hypothetical protein O3G_MSEX002629 [Manduca sexta]|uniref:Uncharacterized protein n=1 Tax=Manduca sexta TaxID=7130 RepID=A0A921YQP9_MANSE|nr:hypothetical protein O3G_MSEX002629 [Manduca sexta]